jgi:hypothetical protein
VFFVPALTFTAVAPLAAPRYTMEILFKWSYEALVLPVQHGGDVMERACSATATDIGCFVRKRHIASIIPIHFFKKKASLHNDTTGCIEVQLQGIGKFQCEPDFLQLVTLFI